MKLVRIIALSALLLIFFAENLSAQNYRTSFGAKLLWDRGMSQGGVIKRFIPRFKTDKNNDAVELTVNRLWKGGLFTLVWLRHNPLYLGSGGTFHGLYWYWGTGFHTGDFRVQEAICRSLTGINRIRENNRITKFGVDWVVGIEYELDNLDRHQWFPFQISMDFKPYYDIYSSGCGGNWVLAAALSFGLAK
ncbi:MAG: hypothetical protein JKX95_07930 [Bacteroidia bacterium]|nr:hypothetical protein [Bacteroidia bacterium]